MARRVLAFVVLAGALAARPPAGASAHENEQRLPPAELAAAVSETRALTERLRAAPASPGAPSSAR